MSNKAYAEAAAAGIAVLQVDRLGAGQPGGTGSRHGAERSNERHGAGCSVSWVVCSERKLAPSAGCAWAVTGHGAERIVLSERACWLLCVGWHQEAQWTRERNALVGLQ